MTISKILRLEDLSMVIFVEVSPYLSGHELYLSFAHLNNHLDSIFKSIPNLHVITTCHEDPVLSFFQPFGTIEIHFDHSSSSSLAQYNLSNFFGIQSFIIDSSINPQGNIRPIEQLEDFLHPDLSPHLQSLRIPHCSERLAHWIFRGTFSQLKICHLCDDKFPQFVLPSWTNHQLPSLDHIHSSYSLLKRLRLSRLRSFLFRHTNQFDLLLSYFPNLTHLHLTVDQCPARSEILDFYEIAQSLHRRVSCFNTLQLRIYVTSANRSLLVRCNFKQITELHPLFRCLE